MAKSDWRGSAGGSSGFLYNLRIDKNDNQIGNYFLASNQLPTIGKAGNDIVMINKKFINLWRDLRLSDQPQVYLNVRSYSNPDSVVFVNNINAELPGKYSLSQNYPNPFNPITNVKFSMYNAGQVKLVVYDVQGREVQTLVNEKLNAGTYEIKFDGSMLNSGVYFYKLMTDGFTETKKMLLIK